jgi:hypothetical protein
MKNVYDVLKQKEADRDRVQGEIDALRLTIPLLEDEKSTSEVESDHPATQDSNENPDSSSQSASSGGWLDRWKMASR